MGKIILGCALFAVSFDLFLEPNDLNAGGVSGLAMVLVQILGFGSVGVVTALMNLPLFALGGMKIGKNFFWGSLAGMIASSALLDLLTFIPIPKTEPLLGALYGGVLCGLGLGLVFTAGASTGGSDIVVRLLKMKWQSVPIGTINICFDMTVAVLTGIVFKDFTRTLYSGVAVFVTGQVIDAVVYRFDYSKVALIISKYHEKIAQMISDDLGRGATYLHGEGSYSREPTEVVLTAVKKQQIADLKRMVSEIDPDAFIIVQEAHQVLGDGFSRYSKDCLLALVLLLSGCTEGSYVSVKPHQGENTSGNAQAVAVGNYEEMLAALKEMVAGAVEQQVLSVADMDENAVTATLDQAIRTACRTDPMGAYAVEEITYERGQSGNLPAVAVSIRYNRTRREILQMPTVADMDQAASRIQVALNGCNSSVVMLVEQYEATDFVQLIEDYAASYPEWVIEIPTVAEATYPEAGDRRILELKFSYQTSRESLRTMQSRVQSVFDSARLYVQGDSSDHEKYNQLFSFLTQRFDYKAETSITAPYSLLCHGVGDSRAFATCYAAMCARAGLSALVVSGTRNGEPWFWNIVEDDGDYYHVDPAASLLGGDFRELRDEEMEGYVWDYSEYPACVGHEAPPEPAAETETTAPVGENEK